MLTLEQFNAMSDADKAQAFAKMQAARKPTKLTLKVSAKGALSIYGFGKWPVTLYRSQWERLIASVEEITAFIEANEGLLAVKD